MAPAKKDEDEGLRPAFKVEGNQNGIGKEVKALAMFHGKSQDKAGTSEEE